MKNCKRFMRNFALATLLGILFSVAGCATAGKIKTGEEIVIGCTSFSRGASANRTVFPDYRITPGDVLDVSYQVESWKEQSEFKIAVDHILSVRFVHHPELNETQHVRPDGNISLAFLGSVRVVGKTVDELSGELKKQYGEHLKETELYIVIEEFRGAINELKEGLKSWTRGSSRLVKVRPDGSATFAMIGDLYVTEKTMPELSAVLNETYQDILPGLSVDLALEESAGSQIYVFGEVNQPGAFQIFRPTSLFEALALAGSITTSARIDSVIVFRQEKNQVLATRMDLKKIMMPVKARRRSKKAAGETEMMYKALQGDGPEYRQGFQSMFYLRPDDIVYIPRRRLNSAAQIATEVSELLFFDGWDTGLSFSYSLNPED